MHVSRWGRGQQAQSNIAVVGREKGHDVVIQLQLEKGANIEAKDLDSRTQTVEGSQ